MLSPLLREFRLSARDFVRTPVWTASLVLTIALGIASNTSVDAFVRGLVNQGPPMPSGMVSIFADDGSGTAGPLSRAQFEAVRAHTGLFASLGAARETHDEAWLHSRRLLVSIAAVTPDLATLLQLPATEALVISDRLWHDDLSRLDVAGKSLTLAHGDLPIRGVAPSWLGGLYRGRPVDIWMPLTGEEPVDRHAPSLWVIGRSQDRSPAEIGRLLNESVPGLIVQRYSGLLPETAAGMARIAWLLRLAAIAVFATACANVASFLLARASARTRDTAVRVAIGAGRRDLIRQVLADSVLIALAGCAAGAVLSFWAARLLPAFLFDQDADQMIFAVDAGGVLAIAAACAVISIASGLLPLIQTRRGDPGAILQREGTGQSPVAHRIGAGLVTVQMTACTLLVITAGLLLSGFQSALHTTAGRRLSNPALATVEGLQTSSPSQTATNGIRYFGNVERASREVLDPAAVAWVAPIPGDRPIWQAFDVELSNRPYRTLQFERHAFTPQTIDTLVTPPAAGRLFGVMDNGRCPGVVISIEAAKALGGRRAIGRSIETPAGEWAEVIGVVHTRDGIEPRARVYHYDPRADAPVAAAAPAEYRVVDGGEAPRAVMDVHIVSPSYFDVLDLPLAGGRTFEDAAASSCRMAIVNEPAANLYFGGQAVGSAIVDRLGRRTTVVGVVRQSSLRAAQRAIDPAVYFPMSQDFHPRMTLVAAGGDAAPSALQRLRRRLATIPGGREDRIIVTTLDAHLSRTALAPERIASVLVAASATIALALGILGLYGVMSDAARRRQREFALRMALGARGGHLFRQVITEGVRLAAAGTVAGALGALAVGQWISGITPMDAPLPWWVWASAPLLLTAAVTVASVLPARRAVGIDPLTVMRED